MLDARTSPSASWLLLGALALVCLTGFAPFKSEGLAIFRVANGQGPPPNSGQGLTSRQVEAPALVHTLSSRFGGGGALFYIEYTPDASGVSGLLLIDLRHAGLPDLETSLITLPDRRRVEIYYQEWDATGDLFLSSRSVGDVQIIDMFRGERVSAASVSFDVTFLSEGRDGVIGTVDDVWRRIEGRATTSPTVDEAVQIEADLVFDRRRASEPYAPDGDIYITCVGDTYVEEESYDEDSYVYEDDGGGCEGDTWEDDSVDPQESGGCAGETVVDDGEPNVDGGCETTDEFEDPSDDDEDSFYDDDSYEDDSGCEGDTTDTTDSSDTSDDSSDDSGCESDIEAAMPPGERARLRQALMSDPRAQARSLDRRPRHRFEKKTRTRLRRVFSYTPFFLLGFVIHLWRRRLQRAPSSRGALGG